MHFPAPGVILRKIGGVFMKKFLVFMLSIVSLGLGVVVASEESATAAAAEESKSQAISSHSYDAASKVLTIVFERGTYKYSDVPAEVYEAFKNSESQGTYYRNEIKGKYTSTKE
jgi:KTSC domain